MKRFKVTNYEQIILGIDAAIIEAKKPKAKPVKFTMPKNIQVYQAINSIESGGGLLFVRNKDEWQIKGSTNYRYLGTLEQFLIKTDNLCQKGNMATYITRF